MAFKFFLLSPSLKVRDICYITQPGVWKSMEEWIRQTYGVWLQKRKWHAWETHCLCRLFSSPRTPESSNRHWVTLQSGQRAEGLPCPVHSRMSAADCCSPGSTESVAFPLLIVEICYPSITVIQKARHTGHRKGRKCRIGEGDILFPDTLCKPKNFLKTLCSKRSQPNCWQNGLNQTVGSWSEKESLAGVNFTASRVSRLSFQ